MTSPLSLLPSNFDFLEANKNAIRRRLLAKLGIPIPDKSEYHDCDKAYDVDNWNCEEWDNQTRYEMIAAFHDDVGSR